MNTEAPRVSDERLRELIRKHKESAIYFEQASDNGRLLETLNASKPEWELHDLLRELLSLRAAQQPAQAPAAAERLTEYDEAIAAELPRVSHVQFDSHEICKHFAGKVRVRLATRSGRGGK